jgi:hypothetical protein
MEIILKGKTCKYNTFINRVIFRFVYVVAQSELFKKPIPGFKSHASCTVAIVVTVMRSKVWQQIFYAIDILILSFSLIIERTEKFLSFIPSLKF